MKQTCEADLKWAAVQCREFLLPEIEEAFDVACRSYALDRHNDAWVFGTCFWRNLWNRVSELARREETPFSVASGEGFYELRLGRLRLRHHRVNPPHLIPRNASAAKASASYNQMCFEGFGFEERPLDNAVLAINGNPQDGLQEVFLGFLGSVANGRYTWLEQEPIMIASVADSTNGDFAVPANFVAEEPVLAEPEVRREVSRREVSGE